MPIKPARPFTVRLPTGQAVPFVPPLGAAHVAWSAEVDRVTAPIGGAAPAAA